MTQFKYFIIVLFICISIGSNFLNANQINDIYISTNSTLQKINSDENKAFTAKLMGKYEESFDLFKALIIKDKENYNNFLYLSIMSYLKDCCNKKEDFDALLINLKTSVTNPFVNDTIKYHLMLDYLVTDYSQAQNLHNELGYIDDFFIIGPFKNENRNGMKINYPPENKIDFDAVYNNSCYHAISWKRINNKNLNYLNLKNYFTPNENAVAYLLTYIKITNNGYYDIIYGSDDGIKIWVNNQLVDEKDSFHLSCFEQNRLKVILRKGINKILVKTVKEYGDWVIYFRILPNNYHISKELNPEKIFQHEQLNSTNYLNSYQQINVNSEYKDDFHKGLYYFITHNFPDNNKLDTTCFITAVKSDSNNSIYNYYYGLSLNQNPSSKEYFLKTIDNLSSNNEAYLQLGLYYNNLNDYDSALNYFQKAQDNYSGFYLPHFYMGLLFYNNNLFSPAIKEFNYCISNNLKSYEANYYLGEINYNLLNYQFAKKFFLNSFQLDPGQYNEKLISLLSINNLTNEIISLLMNNLNFNNDNPVFLNDMASYYFQHNNLKKSLEIINSSLDIDSYNPSTLKIASDIMIDLSQTNKAISYLNKILESDPHNRDIKRRIQFLNKENFETLDDYVSDIDKLKKQVFSKSLEYYKNKYPNKSGLIFYDSKVIKISDNGTTEKLITKIYYILDKNGIKEFNSDSIGYNPDIEKVEILKAKTVYRDNTEYPSYEKNDQPLLNEEENLYYKYNIQKITFPNTAPDTIIIFQYNIWSKNESEFKKSYFSDKLFWKDYYPILSKDYTLIIPKNMNIYYDYKNFKNKLNPTIQINDNSKIYQWIEKNIEQLYYENDMPSLETIIPTLIISSFNSWAQIGDWIWKLSIDQINYNDEMNTFINKINDAHYENKQLIINKIFSVIRDQIRYVGIEYGLSGIQPRDAISVFTSKYGDCKDKALLMVTLLKKLNIESYLGLVKTSDKGRDNFSIPYLGSFNHAICIVKNNNIYQFYDPTANYYNAEELPFSDRLNGVFIIDPSNYSFLTVPPYIKDENLSIINSTNIINNDLSLDSKRKIIRNGQFAPYLRYLATVKDQHKKELEDYWNSLFPGTTLTYVDYQIENNYFEYEILIKDFIQKISRINQFPAILNKTDIYYTYCLAKEKKYPIDFNFPYKTIDNNTYILKLPINKLKLPQNRIIKNKYFNYTLSYKRSGNVITLNKIFELKKTKIYPKEYLQFQKACKTLNNYEEEKISYEN